MVTKGLDFENVSIVGILNADQLVNYSDFRSSERGFQLMSQVSGRAGLKKQTRQGDHSDKQYQKQKPLLPFVINHDYKGFFAEEIQHRRKFNYPPFSRLIQLTFKHEDKKKTWEASLHFAAALRAVGSNQVKYINITVLLTTPLLRPGVGIRGIKMRLQRLGGRLESAGRPPGEREYTRCCRLATHWSVARHGNFSRERR